MFYKWARLLASRQQHQTIDLSASKEYCALGVIRSVCHNMIDPCCVPGLRVGKAVM